MNSPMFHIGNRSTNVYVSGVTIRVPSSQGPVNLSHNTDACDVNCTFNNTECGGTSYYTGPKK
jgi:hypothetical protein